MKITFFCFALLCTFASAAAQTDLAVYFEHQLPQARMRGLMANSFGANAVVLKRVSESAFWVGGAASIGSYGGLTTTQTYRHADGSGTLTDMHVGNNHVAFAAAGRLDLRAGGNMIPYVAAKTGYAHYWTNLRVDNPGDADNSRPLERAMLLEDGTFFGTLGAGVRWDVGSLFKKAPSRRYWLDLAADYTAGGRVRFMNASILPGTAGPPGTPTVVHRYHTGDVYAAPLSQLSLRVGFLLRVGGE